jgi:hypothetical protein
MRIDKFTYLFGGKELLPHSRGARKREGGPLVLTL